jgi:hypothetical protein
MFVWSRQSPRVTDIAACFRPRLVYPLAPEWRIWRPQFISTFLKLQFYGLGHFPSIISTASPQSHVSQNTGGLNHAGSNPTPTTMVMAKKSLNKNDNNVTNNNGSVIL